ncbi:MAG: chromate transporter [Lachnospiraceae bacterium]|nr:chromate transporter [Lachnospiraceae bacterium]
MIYLDLFIGFLKVGLFSFGGGYVSIALIREVVLSHGWMDDEMLTYMIAVSESTPGPLMVNLATYIGSSKGGIPGAVIATGAVVMPAFLLILIIMILLKELVKNKYFKACLEGLKPCIIGIILATGIFMIIKTVNIQPGVKPDMVTGILSIVLGGIYFGSRKIFKKGLPPIALICIAGVSGIIVYGLAG